MIQVLELMRLSYGNRKAMLIDHTDNQQDGHQISDEGHYSHCHPYVRVNPFILIQKEFMINLHKCID